MTNEFEEVRRKAEDAWVPKLTAELTQFAEVQ